MDVRDALGNAKEFGGKALSKAGGSTLAIAGGFVGDAFNVFSAASTFNTSMDDGDHVAIAASKGALDFVVGETFYGAMGLKGMGLGMAVTMGASLGAEAMKHGAEMQGEGLNRQKSIGSGHFNMTEAGYTMRQRSLNAIRSNGVNINSAFGNEARNYYVGL